MILMLLSMYGIVARSPDTHILNDLPKLYNDKINDGLYDVFFEKMCNLKCFLLCAWLKI